MRNEKAKHILVWGGLHEALQWFLFIPVTLGLTVLFSFLFNIVCALRGDFEGIFLYFQTTINAALSATILVNLALNLAPRAPRVCAWAAYSVWSIFIVLSLVRVTPIVFFKGEVQAQQSDVIELLQGIGWLCAGVFSLVALGRKSGKLSEKS